MDVNKLHVTVTVKQRWLLFIAAVVHLTAERVFGWALRRFVSIGPMKS